MGCVLVFIGPSGSGKSTVVRALHRSGVIEVTPSWTTRPRRADELDGSIEHRFVDDAEFDDLEKEGFFLDVVRPFALPYRYGLPQIEEPPAGRVPAIMVRAPHLPLVARHFPDHLIYQIEGTDDRTRARRSPAGSDEARPGTRYRGHEEERQLGRTLAHRVFVNATTPAELVSAMTNAIESDFPTEERIW